MKRRKKPNSAFSPVSCLIPQIREDSKRKAKLRRRVSDEDLSLSDMNRFDKYFSVGGLELPEREAFRRRYVRRSPTLAIAISLFFILVWCLCR